VYAESAASGPYFTHSNIRCPAATFRIRLTSCVGWLARAIALLSSMMKAMSIERGYHSKRLSTDEERIYEKNLAEISNLCTVSIENVFNSGCVIWFWEHFVVPASKNVSITLDIGHLDPRTLIRLPA
jgi:hypothetical protein